MKNFWKDENSIPTTEYFPFDYGKEVNDKIRSLGWTAEQYDAFLDWMHQEKPIDELVALVLFYAPNSWIEAEADAIGIFDTSEETEE